MRIQEINEIVKEAHVRQVGHERQVRESRPFLQHWKNAMILTSRFFKRTPKGTVLAVAGAAVIGAGFFLLDRRRAHR